MRKNVLTAPSLLRKSALTIFSLLYIFWWFGAFFAWIYPLVQNGEIMFWTGGAYFGNLTSLQITSLLSFIVAGGLTLMGAAFFAAARLLKTMNLKIKNTTANWEPPQEPTIPKKTKMDELYPLELGKALTEIGRLLKKNALKIGILFAVPASAWLIIAVSAKLAKFTIFMPDLLLFAILSEIAPFLSVTILIIGMLIIGAALLQKKVG